MPKHDHDKHKHDHDKHKHDHHKHKHDHDKHKHDKHHHDDSSASSASSGGVEPPIVDATTVTPIPVSAATGATVAAVTGSSYQVEQVQQAMASTNISPKKKLPIKSSQLYGGEGGEAFDDGFHKKVVEIGVNSGAIVDSVYLLYYGGQTVTHGGEGGDEQKLTLRGDEYIVEIIVRYSKVVQCLTFKTNLGRVLGPCGGKGGLLLPGGLGGQEKTISAPGEGYGLKGIKGRKGKYLDAIGFHWGGVSTEN